MEKHFCDRCGKEIKGTPKKNIVFDSELCEDCAEKIKYFINNSNRAIAQYKLEHGYTLTREEIDILNEDDYTYLKEAKVIKTYSEKKDECEGCICFSAMNDDMYTRCSKLIHTVDKQHGYHNFNCTERGLGIGLPASDFEAKGKILYPKDFSFEEGS
jgi:hypothetical protein